MYSIRELAIRTLMQESDLDSEMTSVTNLAASISSDPVLPTSHDKIELIFMPITHLHA